MVGEFRINVEIQGNIRRFDSIVKNREICFKIISSDNSISMFKTYWDGEYDFTDMNIEQGRRFKIEVNVGVFVLPHSINIETEHFKTNLKCMCLISNNCFDVVDCKIV